MHAALSWVTADLLAHPERVITPATLLFYVRRYPEAPSPALHAAIANALGEGIAAFERESDARLRWRWLGAFADSAVMVADDALTSMIETQLPGAVDSLERLVRRDYEPGEGVTTDGSGDGLLLALSLLVAFDLTARLPYAMLAEELLQTARRSWGSPDRMPASDAVVACHAAQLCCRLAALHRDPDYLARAVVAPAARYEETAAALLEALHDRVREQPHAVAEYGLAVLDWFALSALPN